jgi:hypothetical protein
MFPRPACGERFMSRLSLPACALAPWAGQARAPLSLDGRGVGGEGVRWRRARRPTPSPFIPLPPGEREKPMPQRLPSRCRDSWFLGKAA